jgi:hypothetical protein
LKAGSGLCELACSSRWPSWRRCFCIRQDDGDALLIALVFIGAVEAEAFMESIMVRAAAAADIFSNDSDRGLGGLYGQGHRPVSVSSAELHRAPRVLVCRMASCADVSASAPNGGSWAL